MYDKSRVDRDFALRAAHALESADLRTKSTIFAELLRRKELSMTVHQLNLLLSEAHYRELAKRALRNLQLPT